MSTITVDVRTLTEVRLPDVCAISGVRTGNLVRFRAMDEPVSDRQWWSALYSLSADVSTFASLSDRERNPVDVWLPVCKPAQDQHRRTLTLSASLLGIGIGIGLGSASIAGPGLGVVAGVLSVLAGLGVSLWSHLTWPRVRVHWDEMSATIMGVNPVFSRALAARN